MAFMSAVKPVLVASEPLSRSASAELPFGVISAKPSLAVTSTPSAPLVVAILEMPSLALPSSVTWSAKTRSGFLAVTPGIRATAARSPSHGLTSVS